METLRTLLADLGTAGALRNVEAALRDRRAEEHAVTALAERLARTEGRTTVAA
jgi:hypothetical protein